MKFSISQTELQNALNVTLKGTSTKSTLPVLSGIYIKTNKDSLIFQSTDLDLSIQYEALALIEEEGETVVPGKLFSDIIKNFSDAAVHVSVSDNTASILCDSSSFIIHTLDPADFPAFPKVEIQQELKIPAETFINMVREVSKAASKDETKPAYTGINISLENSNLSMVTTDTYRLAFAKQEITTEAKEFQAVISSGFMSDIASFAKGVGTVTLALTENQIVITCNNTIYINRKIEGNFPPYKRIIPSSYTTRIKVDKQKLISAVKRASILTSTVAAVKFEIDIPSQTLQLSATHDTGSSKETLPISGEGENIQIGFNCAYLVDGISSIESDDVYIEFINASKPGVFKPSAEDNFLYLVMPIRV